MRRSEMGPWEFISIMAIVLVVLGVFARFMGWW